MKSLYVVLCAFLFASLPAQARDGAIVVAGPCRLQFSEADDADTIRLGKYQQRNALLVGPQTDIFNGFTYRFGLFLSDKDYSSIKNLKEGAKVVFAVTPGNGDSKSLLFTNFKMKRPNGTTWAAEISPDTNGQLTAGTVQVKRGKDDKDDQLVFTIGARVKNLTLVVYQKGNPFGNRRTISGISTVQSTVLVTR